MKFQELKTKNFKSFGTKNLNEKKLRDLDQSNKNLGTKILNGKNLRDFDQSNKSSRTKN